MSGSGPAGDITSLLRQAQGGDIDAAELVLPEIYADLRRIARARLRGERADTLGTTGLVHEAWLGMAAGKPGSFDSRQHYFAYAARIMRHVLTDRARRRLAGKRQPDPADPSPVAGDSLDMVALDQALIRLSGMSERLTRVVELRVFAGLSHAEIGALLGVTERTVERDWRKARMVLSQLLVDDGEHPI
jgi:RNA polymerase sigma factor (TIGR02999 family)